MRYILWYCDFECTLVQRPPSPSRLSCLRDSKRNSTITYVVVPSSQCPSRRATREKIREIIDETQRGEEGGGGGAFLGRRDVVYLQAAGVAPLDSGFDCLAGDHHASMSCVGQPRSLHSTATRSTLATDETSSPNRAHPTLTSP